MVKALDRKLLRDLWRMKGQAAAIALVIAAGVAMYVSQISVLQSLRETQLDYYARHRFADVFAGCKRAPLALMDDIRAIPGVENAEARVTLGVTLDIPRFDEPASGMLISYPEAGQPSVNDIFLRDGDLALGTDEVAAGEAFCNAHGFRVGDSFGALINGRFRTLTIAAIVLSPEYIYALPAGSFIPDDRRFGVFWMNERDLAAAYDMDGAFNDVALTLAPDANARDVMHRLDILLEPYGGLGAMPRAEQLSHWYVENEITQLEQFGAVIPLIFLGVAAFLLNVVMTRLIATQRDQVAALKAFGYSNHAVAMHYVKLVLLIAAVGGVVGIGVGGYMGSGLMVIYEDFFQFPELRYRLNPALALQAFAITGGAAIIGAVSAVRRAASLPPAEAMRPEAPPTYRPTLVERIGLNRVLSQPTRMILRELERRPLKAALSALGIGMAAALLVVGWGFMDMFEHMMDVQTNVMQREDATVTFNQPRNRSALHELQGMEGVLLAEPFRSVPARLRFEHRSRLTGISGVANGGTLSRVMDENLRQVRLPQEGIAMSRVLGDVLGVRQGDMVTVEVLEGARPVRSVRVAALIDDFVGMSAYMEIEALNRLMREDGVISGAYLGVHSGQAQALYKNLQRVPGVAGITIKEAAIRNLREQMAESMLASLAFSVLFAGVIAFGVVYNSARISLSERARELASLRVLGLTRGEISYILLGELAILTLVAIPLGCAIGYGMAAATLGTLNTEVIRIPFVMTNASYAFAATVVLTAAAISALIVRERLDNLDLVEVLKTRE